MLKSDHRELSSSKVKLMWWVGRWWWFTMMTETVKISTESIYRFIALLKTLSLSSDLVNSPELVKKWGVFLTDV